MSQPSTDHHNQQLHILLATDGSTWSAGATRVAVDMAVAYTARLTAVTMLSLDPDLEVVDSKGQHVDEVAVAQNRFAQVRALAEEVGIICSTELRYGAAPHQEIVTAAAELAADVIVMGRRGERGLAQRYVGDATVKAVSLTDLPVVVVPETANYWQHRILVATDGSEHSRAAVAAAGRFAALSKLPVTVLSVSRSNQSETQQWVDSAVREFETRGLTVESRVIEGQPEDVIPATATELGADLVVLGSHGRTGITKLLLGSVSTQVIAALKCPALVVAKPKQQTALRS